MSETTTGLPASAQRMAKLAETEGWSTVVLDGRLAVRDGQVPTTILRCSRGDDVVVAVWRCGEDGAAKFETGILRLPTRLLGHAGVKAYLKGELDPSQVDGQPCEDATHSPRVENGQWMCEQCVDVLAGVG